MRIFIFCLLFFVITSSFSQDEPLDIYPIVQNSISKLFLRCDAHEDSLFTGSDTIYFKMEDIQVIVLYEKGLKIKAVGYYSNGNKYRETNFNGFNMSGIDTRYYKNGVMKYQTCYNDGTINMAKIKWHSNGAIQGISYKDTSHHGKSVDIMWYQDGIMEYYAEHIDSTKSGFIEKRYYENGNLSVSTICNNGKQDFETYYESGSLRFKGVIMKDEIFRLGKWQEWFENGAKRREYFFNDSIPNIYEGIWKWWDENGNLIKHEKYKNGELIESKNH